MLPVRIKRPRFYLLFEVTIWEKSVSGTPGSLHLFEMRCLFIRSIVDEKYAPAVHCQGDETDAGELNLNSCVHAFTLFHGLP